MTASPSVKRRPLPPLRTYSSLREGEPPFWIYLIVSSVVFIAGVALGAVFKPAELPRFVEVDLTGLVAVENEPPPLGEPDSGAPAAPPEPEPEPEPPPIPQPEVMEEPNSEPEPMPEVAPEFAEPQAATPPPAPRPRATPAPRPRSSPPALRTSRAAAAGGDNLDPNARPGPRGSPTGTVGGRGGGAGDFTSRPGMPADATIMQRKYYGRGTYLVNYTNGRITDVQVIRSSGFPYVDTKVCTWVKNRWRVRAGSTGAATLPVEVRP